MIAPIRGRAKVGWIWVCEEVILMMMPEMCMQMMNMFMGLLNMIPGMPMM
ncbi:hypothetical protein ACWF9G_21810 [Nocardia sp. NPDC055029]